MRIPAKHWHTNLEFVGELDIRTEDAVDAVVEGRVVALRVRPPLQPLVVPPIVKPINRRPREIYMI